VTNKTVIQRTANTNAIQVNRYDAQGNLKSSEVDSKSWEDRDTQKYEWTDKDDPPAEVHSTPADDRLEKFFSAPGDIDQTPAGTPGAAVDKDALVLASSERRDVPAVCWSGTHVEEEAGKDAEHRTTTKMDGSQWSRSGESVWISSSAVSNNDPTSPTSNVTVLPLKAVENGDALPPILPNGSTPVVITSPAPAPAPQQEQQPPLSVEERRKRRSLESQARRQAAAATAISS